MKPETMSSKTGPYTVEKSGCVYIIMGPDGRWPFHFTNEGIAKIRANDLNIAYMAGQESSRWIPVSERLPEFPEGAPNYEMYVRCNVLTSSGSVDCARWARNMYAKTERGRMPRWESYGNSGTLFWGEVTHWQPLPKAPNT